MAINNPWLGLASYEEPKNDGTDYEFCGRDEETLEMVRLIDNNLFVTLYGSSGIGKTSLLRAGVIPILRRKDYFPLYVRLSQEPKEISYAEAIIQRMTNCGLVIEKSANVKHPNSNDRLFLWEYFATTRFLYEGREVYPVIILDQFEEVFREGDKVKAELLLKQIYLLLNDELEMPDKTGWSADTNYRFVASIREDFLFVLEDSIDENSLDLYKNNRYRLRSMKPEQARQVVLVPGKKCIEETEKDAVAERIITLAKRPQSDDIDTLMLSLVCAGTYEKKCGEKITLSDLAIWKNNPMEVYYKDAVKGLSASQIRYIQQHLIREDGSRRRVDADEVKAFLGEATYLQLTRGENRLFAIGDKGQVELLHDQLGMAVYEERRAFEEQERKKKQRRNLSMIIGLFLLLAILGIGVGVYSHNQAKRAEDAQKIAEEATREKDNTIRQLKIVNTDKEMALQEAKEATNEKEKTIKELEEKNIALAQLNAQLESEKENVRLANWGRNDIKAKFVAMNAEEFVSEDSYMASIAALNVLPSSDNPDFPYVPEAEYVLRKANRIDNTILKGHTKGVLSVAFSPNGKQIASLSSDKTIRIWSTESGQTERVIPVQYYSEPTLQFSPTTNGIIVTGRYSQDIIYCDGNIEKINNPYLKRISTSRDGEITINGNKHSQKLIGHHKIINSIKFSSDSTLVVSASSDSTVRIWRVNDGKCMGILRDHKNFVEDATLSNDGKHLVSVSRDSVVHLWNVKSRKDTIFFGDERTYKIPDGYAKQAFISPDNNYIAFPSTNSTVYIWDIEKGKISKLDGYKKKINSVRFSPDSRYLASWSDYYNDEIRLWKVPKPNSSYITKAFWRDANSSSAITTDGAICVTTENSTLNVTMRDFKNGMKATIRNGIGKPVFSSDGSHIVSLIDNTIHLWDTAHQIVDERIPIKHNVENFILLKDRIISSNRDSSITLWDTQSIKELYTVNGRLHYSYMSPIYNVVINTPKDYLLTLGHDGFAIIRSYTTGKTIKRFGRDGYIITKAILSPSGKYMVTSSSDSLITIWDVTAEKEIKSYKSTPYSDFLFSADESFVVYTTDETTIVRNLHNFNIIAEFPKTSQQFVISPNDKYLIMRVETKDDPYSGDIKIYNIKAGREEKKALFENNTVYISEFSSDLKLLAIAGDNKVKIFNTENWDLVDSLSVKYDYGITGMDFDPDGKSLLISNSIVSAFQVWDFTSMPKRTNNFKCLKYYDALFSPDDRLMALRCNNNLIHIFDSLKIQNDKHLEAKFDYRIRSIISDNKAFIHYAFSPDGNLFVTSTNDSLIKVWNTNNGELLQTINKEKRTYYRTPTFGKNGRYIIAGGSDSTICIWDALSGAVIRRWHGHDGSVNYVKFCPNDMYVVSVSNVDQTLKLWTTHDWSEVKTIPLVSYIYEPSFSPDGKNMLTYDSKEVIIWDVSSGKPIESIRGGAKVQFSKDGRHILLYDKEKVEIYDFLPTDALIEETRKRFKGRVLTTEEKNKLWL